MKININLAVSNLLVLLVIEPENKEDLDKIKQLQVELAQNRLFFVMTNEDKLILTLMEKSL